MYAVVRTYSGKGASDVFDLIEQREDEVKELIEGVPGFVSYTALRTDVGGITATVCEDKAGTDESSKRAAGFVAEHLESDVDPPEIAEGNTTLQL